MNSLSHVCDSGVLGPADCDACKAEARKRGELRVPAVPTSASSSEASANSGVASSVPQFPKALPYSGRPEPLVSTNAIFEHNSPNTNTEDGNHLTSSNSIVTAETRRSDSPKTPTSVCWLPEPLLVTDFRRHAKFLTICYTICSHVVSEKKLQCGVVVFSTAMHYINVFVYSHGRPESGRWGSIAKVDPATLSAAALFLAVKAENYKTKLSQIVEMVFESVKEKEEDRHNIYKSMTLQVEVMLLATLSGRLTILHPFASLIALAPESGQVGMRANKLYSYTVMTPLSLYFDHHQIAMALVAIVVEGMQSAASAHEGDDNANTEDEDTKEFLPKLTKLLPEAKCATELALIEALVAKGKGCGIAKLDTVVEQRIRMRKSQKKASGPRQVTSPNGGTPLQ